MSAGVKRNINNNVVESVDRKWSPEIHTKIFIPPIGVAKPKGKLISKDVNEMTTVKNAKQQENITAPMVAAEDALSSNAITSSGSDSSESDSSKGRSYPASQNGGLRRFPPNLTLSPSLSLSPSLRSLQKMTGSPPATAATTTGSCGSGQYAAYQHHLDVSPLRSWSDAVSVRSLASIGMGSTDGRKLTITKVPTSPAELLNLASPKT